MASLAPSAASPNATALPRPLLDAATTATRSFRPRSISSEIPIQNAFPNRFPFARARIDQLEVSRAFECNDLCILRFLCKPLAHLERHNLVSGSVGHALRYRNRQQLDRRCRVIALRHLLRRSTQKLLHHAAAQLQRPGAAQV